MQPHRSDIRDISLWTHSPINALKSCEHPRPLPRVWRPGVTSYSELDWNIGEVRVRWTQAGGPSHYHYRGRETQVVSDSQRNTCFRAEVRDRILVTSMKRWYFVRYRERTQRNRFALMFCMGSSGDSWASHRKRCEVFKSISYSKFSSTLKSAREWAFEQHDCSNICFTSWKASQF